MVAVEIAPIRILYYQTTAGRCPFREWFEALDFKIQTVVDARLARVRLGLLGDSKNLGGGVSELKIDVGPGYRIYLGRVGKTVVILLRGGSKKGQSGDIEAAREYWADYVRRTKG